MPAAFFRNNASELLSFGNKTEGKLNTAAGRHFAVRTKLFVARAKDVIYLEIHRK